MDKLPNFTRDKLFSAVTTSVAADVPNFKSQADRNMLLNLCDGACSSLNHDRRLDLGRPR